MYNTHDRDLWLRFRKPVYNVYVLKHSLEVSHLPGSFSSV